MGYYHPISIYPRLCFLLRRDIVNWFAVFLLITIFPISFQAFAKTACLSGTTVGLPAGQSLRVRSGPSANDNVIGSIAIGTRFKVTGYETNGGVIEPDPEDTIDRDKPKNIWLKIAFIGPGGAKVEGWVNFQYVDCSGEKYDLEGAVTVTTSSGTDTTDTSSCSDNFSQKIVYPVPSGYTGQAFKVYSNYMFCGFHTGIDIFASRGTDIVAAATGIVVHIGNMWFQSSPYEEANGVGRGPMAIIVKHGPGLYTTYAHNQSVANGVRVGSCVRRGQVIAGLGNLGYSEAPHLHFEVIQGVDYTGNWETPFPAAPPPDWGPADPVCSAYRNPAAYW